MIAAENEKINQNEQKSGIDNFYDSSENTCEPENQDKKDNSENSDDSKVPRKFKILLIAGILLFVVISYFALTTEKKSKSLEKTNVIIITLDAVRADHLSPFAKDDFIYTPKIEKLASKSFLFDNCWTTNPLTVPAHTSLLTGRYPLAHKIRGNANFHLPAEELTLAEIMKSNGYKTGAFVSAQTTAGALGFNQGFDKYDDSFLNENSQNYDDSFLNENSQNSEIFIPERNALATINRSIDWLKTLDSGDKFFTWLHLFDAHYPYAAVKDFRPQDKRRPRLNKENLPETLQPTNYDAEITYMDFCLGVLFDYLEQKNKLVDTIVIITADHGEALQEHNESTHGYFAYNTTMKVPLIVLVPEKFKQKTRRLADHVSIIDILPTLVESLGLKLPEKSPEIQGVSFTPLLNPKIEVQQKYKRDPIYFESFYPYFSFGYAPILGFADADGTYLHSNPSEYYSHADFEQKKDFMFATDKAIMKEKLDDLIKTYQQESPGNPYAIKQNKVGEIVNDSYAPNLEKDNSEKPKIKSNNASIKENLFVSATATTEIPKNLVSPMKNSEDIRNYELAQQFYSQGLYNKTTQILHKILWKNSEHLKAGQLMASAYQKLARMKLLQKIDENKAKNPGASIIDCWVKGKERSKILKIYGEAAIYYGNYILSLQMKFLASQAEFENAGLLNFLAGNYEQAIEFFEKAAKNAETGRLNTLKLSELSKIMYALSLYYLGSTFEAENLVELWVPKQDSELAKLRKLIANEIDPEKINPHFRFP